MTKTRLRELEEILKTEPDFQRRKLAEKEYLRLTEDLQNPEPNQK